MKTNRISLALAGLLAIASTAAAQDEEVNILPSDAPKALIDLVKKFLPEGSITEVTKRVQDDHVEYGLRIFISGKIAEASFDIPEGGVPEGSIEVAVKPEDLPKAVADAFRKALPDASIPKGMRIITIDEDNPEGHATYEWKLKDPKRSVVISTDGAETAITQRIKEDELPAAVRDALAKDHAGIKIKRIEKITLNGVVSYALNVSGGDDLVATADGKITVEEQ